MKFSRFRRVFSHAHSRFRENGKNKQMWLVRLIFWINIWSIWQNLSPEITAQNITLPKVLVWFQECCNKKIWAMLLHLIFRGRGPTAAGRFWPRWFVLICDLGWWWTWWRSSGTGRGQLSFRQNLEVVADEPASSNKTARLCFIVSIYNNDVIHARNCHYTMVAWEIARQSW